MAPHRHDETTKSTLTVRPARAGDGYAIATIRSASWRSGYRGILPDEVLAGIHPDPERRESHLRAEASGVRQYLAELDGHPVGWAASGPSRDPDTAPDTREIYACYVHPDYWRQGVGETLMTVATTEAGQVPVSLWVLTDNHRGRRFYEALGFVADGSVREVNRQLVLGATVTEVRYVLPTDGP